MMGARDVIEIVERLERAGVAVWLDGGWGVDALLGELTRPHDDLDVVIALDQAAAAGEALAPLGFDASIDERPTRFVLRDGADRRVDFHTVTFDAEGGGSQALQDGRAFRYPPKGFAGRGVVAGRAVRCLTADVQALCHYGYPPDEADHHDMRLLHERHGIPLAPPYVDDPGLRPGAAARRPERGRLRPRRHGTGGAWMRSSGGG